MAITAAPLPPLAEDIAASKAAAERDLASDLAALVRVGRLDDEARAMLDGVERAFGARVLEDEANGPELERCRRRAEQLVAAGGTMSKGVALAYASDIFVGSSIERQWRRREAERIVAKLAALLALSRESVALQLFVGAVRAPELLDVPPIVALEAQLRFLVALGPIVEVSLWKKGAGGRALCVITEGMTTQTRRFRAVAELTFGGTSAGSSARGTILGAPVLRWETPWASVVARTRIESRDVARVFLTEAAAAMSPVLEREVVLERSAARERSLVQASERRLGRLAFDLHDGALQHIAAFGAELFLFKRQLADVVPSDEDRGVVSRVDDLDARLWELDRVLRELAHSLEPSGLVRRPLPRVIADEVAAFVERTGIQVEHNVSGDFSRMTVSQKIALIRIIQEGLTNVREHAIASHVRISVVARRNRFEARLEDNGCGFRVARTLQDAAKRGRLGLVGSSERVRLLGGTLDVRSKLGGPTTLTVSLPRWRPSRVEQVRLDAAPAFAVD